MLSEETIKRIKDSPFFEELQGHIVSEVMKLDSIKGLEGMTNDYAGEEAKVRAKTVEKLRDILSPFFDSREKHEPSVEAIQRVKKRAGY